VELFESPDGLFVSELFDASELLDDSPPPVEAVAAAVAVAGLEELAELFCSAPLFRP
jgi:hypothetical protein